MFDLGSKIANQKNLFDEIHMWISLVITGAIVMLSMYIFIINPNFNNLHLTINQLTTFSGSFLFYSLLVILMYVIGLLAIRIFDFLIKLLVIILIGVHKIKSSKLHKLIDPIYNFFNILNPLTLGSKELSEEYKSTLIKGLNGYFKISGSVNDIIRLCRQICAENNLLKMHRISHFHAIYKGLFLGLAILDIRFILNSNWGVVIVLTFTAFATLFEIHDLSLSSLIDYLDTTYLYVLRKNFNNSKPKNS